MATYLVTGVNRGLGFAFVDNLTQDKSNTVIGTVRSLKNAQALLDLKRSNLHLIEIDFISEIETFHAAFKQIDQISPKGVDIIIHNAAISGPSTFKALFDYKASDYLEPFQVNLMGSVKLYQAVAPYLYKTDGPKAVVFISTLVGQMTNSSFPGYGYGASKAALNYFMRQVYIDNQAAESPVRKQTLVLSVHPGLVKTDMSKEAFELGEEFLSQFEVLLPHQSASKILEAYPKASSGSFIDYNGAVLEF